MVRIRQDAPSSAGVAQLVEQRIRNAKVTSSTPVIGTKWRPCSSVVEHSLGKGEVGSSILLMGTK